MGALLAARAFRLSGSAVRRRKGERKRKRKRVGQLRCPNHGTVQPTLVLSRSLRPAGSANAHCNYRAAASQMLTGGPTCAHLTQRDERAFIRGASHARAHTNWRRRLGAAKRSSLGQLLMKSRSLGSRPALLCSTLVPLLAHAFRGKANRRAEKKSTRVARKVKKSQRARLQIEPLALGVFIYYNIILSNASH